MSTDEIQRYIDSVEARADRKERDWAVACNDRDAALGRAESAEAEVARLTRLLEQRTAALTRTIDAKDAAEAKVARVEALIPHLADPMNRAHKPSSKRGKVVTDVIDDVLQMLRAALDGGQP